MILIKLLKIVIKRYITQFRLLYRNVILSNKNQTCKISDEAIIDNVEFGKYVGVFGGSTILNSKIGDYSYIQTNCRIFNCNIGKFCSIGARVTTAPGKHELNFISSSPCLLYNNTCVPKTYNKHDKYNYNQRVIIENDVWIGEGAIILEGVTIKTGAVVGAYAVVTKDVEPYAIVGGVPAKLIRYRFSKDIISSLLNSKWWDCNEEWFLDNNDLFRKQNLTSEQIQQIINIPNESYDR